MDTQAYNLSQVLSGCFPRNARILTHPDNLQKIQDSLKTRQNSIPDIFIPRLSIPIITNPNLPKEQETGNIVNPDGTVSSPKEYEFYLDRFTIAQEQDLPWLLHFGYVKKEMGPLIYMYNDTVALNDFVFKGNATVLDPVYDLPPGKNRIQKVVEDD